MSSQTADYFAPAERGGARRINPRIFLLALGMFALGTDAFVVAGVLPVISRELGVTESLAGQLVTAFSFTYGFASPVLAALTGRWSRNRVLMVALGAFCLCNLGSALAPNFAILFLTRILVGCCAAVFGPLAYTTGTALAPAEKRGQALALVACDALEVFESPVCRLFREKARNTSVPCATRARVGERRAEKAQQNTECAPLVAAGTASARTHLTAVLL